MAEINEVAVKYGKIILQQYAFLTMVHGPKKAREMYIVNYGNSNCIGKMVNYTKNKNILKALYSRLRHNLRCTKVLKEIKAKLNKYGEK